MIFSCSKLPSLPHPPTSPQTHNFSYFHFYLFHPLCPFHVPHLTHTSTHSQLPIPLSVYILSINSPEALFSHTLFPTVPTHLPRTSPYFTSTFPTPSFPPIHSFSYPHLYIYIYLCSSDALFSCTLISTPHRHPELPFTPRLPSPRPRSHLFATDTHPHTPPCRSNTPLATRSSSLVSGSCHGRRCSAKTSCRCSYRRTSPATTSTAWWGATSPSAHGAGVRRSLTAR